MTRLSVNINKIATLRNSRGGNIPSVKDAAVNCQNLVHRELQFIHDLMKDILPEKMFMKLKP